ncbi:MAG: flagellar basal-body rod protein FlgF [Magnetospirillum sp.]|nr:flagellar basal-body rod protein FlgF [Magnetospirillum sp.]
MENTTYIALSRQAALWRQMEVVANNMANANTTGYKAKHMLFSEYLMPTRSTNRAVGDKLSFVQDRGEVRDDREGPITQTGNPLDLALHGDGYFQVETEAGMRYTRNGHFRLDEGGMLVNSDGLAVMDVRDQPIIFAPNETKINVTPDGTVTTENGLVAKLKVATFANPQDLRAAGGGLLETAQTPDIASRPQIAQRMLEESNVQPVVEMTNMMTILREYEANQNIIEAENNRMIKAMQVLSQTQTAQG